MTGYLVDFEVFFTLVPKRARDKPLTVNPNGTNKSLPLRPVSLQHICLVLRRINWNSPKWNCEERIVSMIEKFWDHSHNLSLLALHMLRPSQWWASDQELRAQSPNKYLGMVCFVFAWHLLHQAQSTKGLPCFLALTMTSSQELGNKQWSLIHTVCFPVFLSESYYSKLGEASKIACKFK